MFPISIYLHGLTIDIRRLCADGINLIIEESNDHITHSNWIQTLKQATLLNYIKAEKKIEIKKIEPSFQTMQRK